MRTEQHSIPDQHKALIEEATRRVCQARGAASMCHEAVADAVRTAFVGGTHHMFGLVRAGSQARS